MNDDVAPSTNPVVDETTGKPKVENILTFPQIHQRWKDFIQDNKLRNNKNAAIQRKRDGEQPYNPRKLKAAGQSWRSNRPTGFMSSMLKRLAPPYKQMVDQLPLLTYAHFPNDKIGTDAKRDSFRKTITDGIRNWDGWSDFLQQLIDEDITFGYTATTVKDQYSWRPEMHRGDEALFATGASQEADKNELFFVRKDMNMETAFSLLANYATNEQAGWRMKNIIAKLNIDSRKFDDKSLEEMSRVAEDLYRENSLQADGGATKASPKILKLAIGYSIDPEGGINKYIFDRDDGTPIFFRRKIFRKMSNFAALFSAEVGDRTLHGSRGAGRALYNTHISIEQARNLIYDALMLSGLLILKKVGKSGVGTTDKVGLTVNHPFAVIGDGYEALEKVNFQVNHEAFFALDRHAVAQAEVQVGAFMPGQILNDDGEKRTASEVNYVASIDAQIRAGILARFAEQMFKQIDLMQSQICHPEVVALAEQIWQSTNGGTITPIYDQVFWDSLVENGCQDGFVFVKLPSYIDKDALEIVVKLFAEGLEKKEILILANSSSKANVDDAIASQSGVLDLIVARYANDPLIDTTELKRRDLASKVGAEAAERLMNVDLNPLSPIKQVRQQAMELATMLSGNEVPVDPTDDDMIHLMTISERLAPMLKNPEVGVLASSQSFLRLVIAHADAHVQSGLSKGMKQEDFAEAMETINAMRKVVEQMALDDAAAAVVDPALQQGAAPGISVSGVVAEDPSAGNAPAPPANPLDIPAPPAGASTPGQIVGDVANPPRPNPPQ